MFLFIRLLLGHIAADFLFQTDEIYTLKKKELFGIVLHASIVFFSLLCFSIPYLQFREMWALILVASVTHGIQDKIKLKISQSKFDYLIFIADQLLHLAVLLPVLLFGFSSSAHAPEARNLIVKIYNNSNYMLILGGYILSVYAGKSFWLVLQTSFSFKTEGDKSFALYGMFERFIITTSLLKPHFLVFLVVPLIARFVLKKYKFGMDLIFNFLFASLFGLLLRFFVF